MAKAQEKTITKKPGRPATGVGTLVGVSLHEAALARLDHWRERHAPKATRPEAVLALPLLLAAPADVWGQERSTWFTLNSRLDRCIVAQSSPAMRMEEVQSSGLRPEVQQWGPYDAPTKVEVGMPMRGGDVRYWTFWRSQEACEAELPRVPDRYR